MSDYVIGIGRGVSLESLLMRKQNTFWVLRFLGPEAMK